MFILCFVPLDFIAVVECLEFPILLPEGVEVVGPAQFPPVLHWSVYLAWPLVTTLIIQIDKNLSHLCCSFAPCCCSAKSAMDNLQRRYNQVNFSCQIEVRINVSVNKQFFSFILLYLTWIWMLAKYPCSIEMESHRHHSFDTPWVHLYFSTIWKCEACYMTSLTNKLIYSWLFDIVLLR